MGAARRLVALGALGGLAALGGCTAMLGDFSTASVGSEGGSEGGGPSPDATVPDGGAPETGGGDSTGETSAEAGGDDGGVTDASGERSDGGSETLDCTTWVYPTPIVLETLTGTLRQVQGALAIYTYNAGGMTDVRVIAGKGDQNAFTLYSLDRTQNPPAPTALTSPTYFGSTFATMRRGPGSAATYGIVVGSVRASATDPAVYEAWLIQDSMAAAGPLPAPYPIYPLTSAQATPTSIHILPLATNEVFTAVESPVTGTPTTYSLGAGVATQSAPLSNLAPVASSIHSDDFTNLELFNDAVNDEVYFFSENDLSSPGLSAWSIPNTAPPDAAAPTKRSVGALAAFVQAIGENTTTSAADIAYVESNVVSGVTSAMTLRVGAISYAGAMPDLDTWQSTDLTVARTYTGMGTLDSPFGSLCGSRWVQDNIMLLGSGLKSAADGGVNPGLALLWVSSNGSVRSEARGPNRLLSNLDDFSGVSAAPISIAADGKSARWAVAWVETKTDDAGKYDVISYDELTCQ